MEAMEDAGNPDASPIEISGETEGSGEGCTGTAEGDTDTSPRRPRFLAVATVPLTRRASTPSRAAIAEEERPSRASARTCALCSGVSLGPLADIVPRCVSCAAWR